MSAAADAKSSTTKSMASCATGSAAPRRVQQPRRSAGSRDQPDIVGIPQVVHLGDERAIAIQEHGRSQRGPRRSFLHALPTRSE